MVGESVTEFTAIKYHTVTKSEVVMSATDLLLSVAKQSEKLRSCRQNEFFEFVMRGKKMPEAKDKAKTEPVYKVGSKSKDYRDGYRAGYLRALKIKKSENGMTDFNRVKVTNDGQWYKTDEFVCSNCGLHLEDWCARDREGGLYEFFFVYCPFCGGKVEEE